MSICTGNMHSEREKRSATHRNWCSSRLPPVAGTSLLGSGKQHDNPGRNGCVFCRKAAGAAVGCAAVAVFLPLLLAWCLVWQIIGPTSHHVRQYIKQRQQQLQQPSLHLLFVFFSFSWGSVDFKIFSQGTKNTNIHADTRNSGSFTFWRYPLYSIHVVLSKSTAVQLHPRLHCCTLPHRCITLLFAH